jgi:hypothetical protein
MVTGVGSYQQAIMNDTLMEELLHEEETETLDFKRRQYLFVGASDDAKSEIVKDVLAFANAWRRTDAYILIGVQEVKGGRSIVHGVTHHLVRLDTFNRKLTWSDGSFYVGATKNTKLDLSALIYSDNLSDPPVFRSLSAVLLQVPEGKNMKEMMYQLIC